MRMLKNTFKRRKSFRLFSYKIFSVKNFEYQDIHCSYTLMQTITKANTIESTELQYTVYLINEQNFNIQYI